MKYTQGKKKPDNNATAIAVTNVIE